MPDITYLVKLGAAVVLFVVLIGSIVVAGILTLQGLPLPPYVSAIAGAGIAQCLTLLGVHLAKNGNGNGNGKTNGSSASPSATPTGGK